MAPGATAAVASTLLCCSQTLEGIGLQHALIHHMLLTARMTVVLL